MRKLLRFGLCLGLCSILTGPMVAHAAGKNSPITVTGVHGEKLTVSKTHIISGSAIRVSGTRFDETIGIYLAFCVIPKKGEMPTPCGGGINQEGIGDASYWISSNPPPYGLGLAKEFQPGGRFSYVMHVSSKIGRVDCRKVRCAITIRTDHTRDTDRTYDMFVRISFN